MLILLVFIVGVVFLFKQTFRLGSRTVTPPKSRWMALALTLPFILSVCFATMQLQAAFVITDDNQVQLDQDVFLEVASQIDRISLGGTILGIIIAAAVYFSIPKSFEQSPFQQVGSTSTPMQPRNPHPLDSYSEGVPPPTPIQLQTPPSIMTVEQAAAYLGTNSAQILKLIDEGELTGARSGGGFVIARVVIDEYMQRKTEQTPPTV